MPMNKELLGTEIKAKIDMLSPAEKQTDIRVWTAVAEAIIEHIKNNAGITAGTLSSSGTGNMGLPVVSQNTTAGKIE